MHNHDRRLRDARLVWPLPSYFMVGHSVVAEHARGHVLVRARPDIVEERRVPKRALLVDPRVKRVILAEDARRLQRRILEVAAASFVILVKVETVDGRPSHAEMIIAGLDWSGMRRVCVSARSY